jgi:hypothetical protein
MLDGALKHPDKGFPGDAEFVVWNREAAFHDMEDAVGGAAVAFGIMENAVTDFVGIKDAGGEFVAIEGNGKGASQAGTIEDKSAGRDLDNAGTESAIEVSLNASIDRGEICGRIGFAAMADDGASDLMEMLVGVAFNRSTAQGSQLEINSVNQLVRGKIASSRTRPFRNLHV